MMNGVATLLFALAHLPSCRGFAPQRSSSFERFTDQRSYGARSFSVCPLDNERRSSVVLRYEPGDPSGESPESLNLALIGQNLANQAILGITIWTGGEGFRVLSQQADWSTFAIVTGVLGVLPMLYVSRKIETSESYLFSGLNLSTNMAVLRLFGATSKPVLALLLSLAMGGLTGVVEEVIFRGQMIPAFANMFGNGNILVGAVLSTALFAILHTNPLSFFKGDADRVLDNVVLLSLQLFNGGYFAYLYLSTGNLAVPIVAHILYDVYTFYKTHLVDVAGQMEYAQRESAMPKVGSRALEQKWIRERGDDFVLGVKESFYLMDTNRDGVLSRKEFRIALFSYGINLSPGQSEKVAAGADLDASGSIDLDEFLEFVGPTGSTRKAVRNTLFGPL